MRVVALSAFHGKLSALEALRCAIAQAGELLTAETSFATLMGGT